MCSPTRNVIDRDEILTAAGHHPYVRLTTTGAEGVRGFVRDHPTGPALLWRQQLRGRSRWCGWGDPEQVARLVRLLWEAGELVGVQRLHLPRTDPALLAGLPVGEPDHWDYLWTRTAPPATPQQRRVVPLPAEQADEVRALLRRAFPNSYTHPGDPEIRRWYGIWEQDRLIACGADISDSDGAQGVGCLAGLTVDPKFRGGGLGAALTSAMATLVLAEFGIASLGVMVDNPRAARLYHRLGFTEVAGRTSVPLHRP